MQASHDPVQALSQQVPSGEQVVPLAHPPPAVWQVCPCLLLHVPVESHVPAHTPGSSWFLTTLHAPFVHTWQAPAQSLRFVHPTHWLLVVSHVAAAPAQYLFAVQATHWPLVAQAGVPGRPAQSLSAVHRPDASTGSPPGGASTAGTSATPLIAASGVLLAAGASGGPAVTGTSATVSANASAETDGPAASGPALTGPSLPADSTTSVLAAVASVEIRLSTARRPSLPPSPARTQSRSGVHTYPGRHGSFSSGAQMFQSRLTQESPDVTGRTSASTHEHTTGWFFMFQVIGSDIEVVVWKVRASIPRCAANRTILGKGQRVKRLGTTRNS